MARTQTYRVVNNRMHFKCPECGTRRLHSVPPDVKQRSVRCQNCDVRVRCNLNRRVRPRQSQLGKAELIISGGRHVEIDLHDISAGGVGFNLPLRGGRFVSPGQRITFKCKWNPGLFVNKNYIIRTVKGLRVGAQITH